MPEQEQNLPFPFPLYGIDTSVPFSKQPEQTTAEGNNVRAYEPETQRGRGGSRPGMSKFIPSRVSGVHEIQCLDLVVRTDGDALTDNFDDPGADAVGDPSDGGRGRGRLIREGGSGRRPWKLRKRTPIVAWTSPVSIALGTPLSGTQLNAAGKEPSDFYIGGAGIPGTYVYDPPSGAVLPLGRHLLSVQFTPDDNLTWRTPPKKKVNLTVDETGGAPGVGTANVSAVDAPNSCTVDSVIIDGLPAPGAEIDYHAGGWPVGRKPIAGNTYAIQTDPSLTYVFTSFLPDQPE